MQIIRLPLFGRLALLGQKGSAPAPTLFALSGAVEDALGEEAYIRVGLILARQGFLCASVDLPCHGEEVREGEQPGSLAGWRRRVECGEPLMAAFTDRACAALDHLVREGYSDPHRVIVCGTSRGGFSAVHFAAAEPRLRAVAAFAPVADLRALREFAGLGDHEPTKALALHRLADRLAGRPLWLCIGNNDQRVGTDHAIAFTRRVVEASVAQGKPAPVELHVMQTEGHAIHPTAHEEAAEWFLRTTS
ncbi:MAG: prolyl oligopeptidase family serine peptidase [Planctomycetes bacterium]|nr:prolyl oligopeptidase family serine peptidase [Planctomycetota bacterium]